VRSSAVWAEALALAQVHGVAALVYGTLKRCDRIEGPDPTDQARLREAVLAGLRLSIRLRQALPGVLRGLAEREVSAVAFKGPALAALAYGDPALRPTTDLDVLVLKPDVPRALEALSALGFVPEHQLQPDYDALWRTYAPWNRPYGNANGYVRSLGAPDEIHLDLHWGVAARYVLFPLDPAELWPRAVTIEIEPGVAVPTFGVEDTLLLLALHGMKHGLDRLRFVADIAELLRRRPDFDDSALLAQARRLRSERMLMVNLALAADLLGAPLPPALARRLDSAPDVKRLARRTAAGMFAPGSHWVRLRRDAAFQLQIRDRTRDGLGSAYHRIRLSAGW
jgi:hypothetical protein